MKSFILSMVFLTSSQFFVLVAEAKTFQVVVETRILEFDPQAGMKSRQTLDIDFSNKSVKSSFETGTTEFFGIQLDSIRNNFVVENVLFEEDKVSFDVKGTTASGAMLTPDIDYSLSFVGSIKTVGTSMVMDLSVSGCHDGYPAYRISYGDKLIYDYEHKSIRLLSLFGTCDVSI